MRLLFAVWRQEWWLQWRSGRLRMALLVYWLLTAVPGAVVAWLVVPTSDRLHGPSSYLGQSLLVQPLLTAVLAALVAGNRSDVSSLEELWCPLASSPISSAGWMLRRWTAMLVLILPISFLPQLSTTALAWSTSGELPSLATLFWTWALRIAPVAILASALWLAMVTIAGSELGAGVLTLVLSGVGPGIINRLAGEWGYRFGDPLDLLGFADARGWFFWTGFYISRPEARIEHRGFVATEGRFDPLAGWEWLFPRMGLLTALAVLALAVALFFTRRTRSDHRPLVVGPTHPLRNLIALANGWRQRYAPGAGHSLGEKLLLLPALVAATLVVGALVDRQLEWKAMAGQRYTTLVSEPTPPMSAGVEPETWQVRGELYADGRIETTTLGTMVHHGDKAIHRLTFTLNPGLQVVTLRAAGKNLAPERDWDRLVVALEPQLEPGQRIELELVLEGVPIHPDFGLSNPWRGISFVQAFERQAAARFVGGRHDFSRGERKPSVSARVIDLRPGDLVPVPRYTTWELTPPPSSPESPGRYVLPERVQPEARLTIDLGAPESLLLADSCANLRLSTPSPDRVRLRGECSVPLGEWVVVGGRYEPLEGMAGGTVVMLPAHRERGAELLSSLDRVLRLSDRAWPSLPSLETLVIFERPPDASVDLTEGLSRSWRNVGRERLHGQLISLPELQVVGGQKLDGESLVALSVAGKLMRRRAFDSSQRHIFRHIFQALVLRRMGLDERGAVAQGPPWLPAVLDEPFERADPFDSEILSIGVPAVMVEVESRLGGVTFYRAVEEFLSREDAPPAKLRDLFTTLEAESGVALDRLYRDYFEQGSMPKLSLAEVGQERRRGGWRIRGLLRNDGTGEVHCPVVLETEIGTRHAALTVGERSASEFVFETSSRPVRVVLDPQKTCYRVASSASDVLERVDLGEEG